MEQLNEKNKRNNFFIHVRGGDYLTNSNFSMNLTNYYQKAIEIFANLHQHKINQNLLHCFIFTNDEPHLATLGIIQNLQLNKINFTIFQKDESLNLIL